MNGAVQADHALLGVALTSLGGPDVTIEFVVDTGFVGYLTLPPAAVGALNLPFVRRIAANLADDSTIHVSVHAATIVWNGQEQEVAVLGTGKRPLLGTLLLAGCELNVRFEDGGLVSVVPL